MKKEIKSKSVEKTKGLYDKTLEKTSIKEIPKVTTGTPGRTDGNLLIQQLGTAGSDAVNGFTGTLGRFE